MLAAPVWIDAVGEVEVGTVVPGEDGSGGILVEGRWYSGMLLFVLKVNVQRFQTQGLEAVRRIYG
jgi:hypothetical protein